MKNVFIFLTGVGVGSVVTWKLLEKKYKDLADEEIESVKETFRDRFDESKAELRRKKEEEIKKIDELEKTNLKDIKDAEEIIDSSNYTSKKEEESSKDEIEEITVSEYGCEDFFETKSWMYWNDGVVTDEFDAIVERKDCLKLLGNAINKFDNDFQVEDIYIRNHKTMCDYEIIRSEKDFNEM